MSELKDNNKNPLTRAQWLKGEGLENNADDSNLEPSPEAAFEAHALKGRTLLANEEEAQALLADLDQAIMETLTKSPKKPAPSGRWKWILFGIITIVLFFLIWWFWPTKTTEQQLYANYFTPLENDITITPMGEETAPQKLDEIFRLYDRGAYEESIPLMESFLAQNPQADSIRLFYGVSLLEVERYTEATEVLTQTTSDLSPSFYQQAATWYLALAWIKREQTTKAIPLLQQLSNSESFYRASAKKLLDQIKSK